MNECKKCERETCPMILQGNTAYRCPIWENERRHERLIRMVKNTGRTIEKLPTFDEMQLEDERLRKRVKIVRGIHENKKNHLFYIYSPPGTGKTHCLLAYASEISAKNINVFYTTASKLREIWLSKEQDEHEKEKSQIQSSQVVIVEDFTREGYSAAGHFQKNLVSLLDSNGLKIILTSNMSLDDPEFPYAGEDWIMDRLRGAFVISWSGKSYRHSRGI